MAQSILGATGVEYDCTVTIDCPSCGVEMVVDIFYDAGQIIWEIDEAGETCQNGCDLTYDNYDEISALCQEEMKKLPR